MKGGNKPIFIVLAVIGFIAATQTVKVATGPILWLNLSSSEPLGLYRMEPSSKVVRRGEIVVMECPKGYEPYLYGRKWLPHGWPLFKTVGATSGDTYCVTDNMLSINGIPIGRVFSSDSKGLSLPAVRGCRTIPKGHFLPIATGLENSFDGRYFGDVHESLVIGTAKPLLTYHRKSDRGGE